MTLVDFILARLDDDEAAARDAALTVGWDGFGDQRIRSGQHWVASYHVVKRVRDDGPTDRRTVVDGGSFAGMDTARHIARHDPARVLADIEAKRRIVALHDRAHRCAVYTQAGDSEFCEWVPAFDACSTLQLLALPYADHPDYQPEWRP